MNKEELLPEVNHTYMNVVNNLVKVISFDNKTNKLHLYNISDSCNMFIDYRKGYLKEKVR